LAIHRIEAANMMELTQDVKDFMRYGCWIYGRYAYSSPPIITKKGKTAYDLYFHDDELKNKSDSNYDFLV